jgi:3-oxoacyl-[acyl-carrier-protein] synthase II
LAIIQAAEHIVGECGERAALAGGADAPLWREQLEPMRCMGILAADFNGGKNYCAPFSLEPRGITPGEGAAFLGLEKVDVERGWEKGEIELAGWAWCSDVRARLGENTGQIGAVLDQAIGMAGCGFDDVGALWGHGSGTAANDNGEWKALEIWCRERRSKPLILLTTKGVTGHAFGATSALEAALACMALNRGILPPSILEPDEVRKSQWLCVLVEALELEVSWIVTLSMGFWGEIAALVFRRH